MSPLVRSFLRGTAPLVFRFLVLAVTSGFLAASAFGTEPGELNVTNHGGNLDYLTIRTRRDEFGKVIHLFGDSIMRGWALGKFPDEISDTDPAFRLRELSSPAHMMNIIFNENHVEAVAAYAGT